MRTVGADGVVGRDLLAALHVECYAGVVLPQAGDGRAEADLDEPGLVRSVQQRLLGVGLLEVHEGRQAVRERRGKLAREELALAEIGPGAGEADALGRDLVAAETTEGRKRVVAEDDRPRADRLELRLRLEDDGGNLALDELERHGQPDRPGAYDGDPHTTRACSGSDPDTGPRRSFHGPSDR